MNLSVIRRKVAEVRNPDERELYMAMDVILSAMETGVNAFKLQTVTNYSRDFLDAVATRMADAGLWLTFIDVDEWKLEEMEGLGLYLHANVALGKFVRELSEDSVIYKDLSTGEVVGTFTNHEYVRMVKATLAKLRRPRT
jgi:hypothetical protein